MGFYDFAAESGLIISSLVYGQITRCATVEKPRHKNGAYFVDYKESWGWVMDWSVHDSPIYWVAGKLRHIAEKVIREGKQKYNEERLELQAKAAHKAGLILSECELLPHYYMENKGFPESTFLVFENKLVIPMHINGKLAGIQTIQPWGEKKFLYGQSTSLAVFRIGMGRNNVLCEGYATGLSIQKCLGVEFSVWVCFSANNMVKVSKILNHPKFVVADNDLSGTGEKAAIASGCNYFMPPQGDYNDYWMDGKLKAQLSLRKKINE